MNATPNPTDSTRSAHRVLARAHARQVVDTSPASVINDLTNKGAVSDMDPDEPGF